MASPSDSTARAVHLRLVESPAEHPSTRALIEDARALDKLGRRSEARVLYEQALRSITTPSPSLASMLMRWIARSYEVDADYKAAEDCAVAAVATAELGDERNALGHALNVLAAVRWRQGLVNTGLLGPGCQRIARRHQPVQSIRRQGEHLSADLGVFID